MLHHCGLWKEWVSELVVVASVMQQTTNETHFLGGEGCCIISWWPTEGLGQGANGCCIVDATHCGTGCKKDVASTEGMG